MSEDREARAKRIGLAIRKARTRLDLTQRQFGERIGSELGRAPIREEQVNRWEAGSPRARPDAEVLLLAAELAKEPVESLLEVDYWDQLYERFRALADQLEPGHLEPVPDPETIKRRLSDTFPRAPRVNTKPSQVRDQK